jgi:hypothetical protein
MLVEQDFSVKREPLIVRFAQVGVEHFATDSLILSDSFPAGHTVPSNPTELSHHVANSLNYLGNRRFHTVNVKNDADEGFLDFLEGDVFKKGLKLATTAQPAIAPLSGMALAITKSISQRNRNVSVQDCYLGLDFAGTTHGARLAEGDYIAVQIPESLQRVWYWDDWVYEPRSGLIVSRSDPNALIPYNYVVFGISITLRRRPPCVGGAAREDRRSGWSSDGLEDRSLGRGDVAGGDLSRAAAPALVGGGQAAAGGGDADAGRDGAGGGATAWGEHQPAVHLAQAVARPGRPARGLSAGTDVHRGRDRAPR